MCHDNADLVGRGALEDVVRVVGVAELALMLPYLTSADEIVAQVDVHQQIGLLRHADFADLEIGAAVALTREQFRGFAAAAGGVAHIQFRDVAAAHRNAIAASAL